MGTLKSYKQRTYLDPIHGPIELNLNDRVEKLISKLIDTKEFQRLRRIRQMGLGSFTFHGAEHTRFGHSLGSLFIAKKMLNHLSRSYPGIKEFKAEILVSALLHDIGHGPFSHTCEKFMRTNHEIWTKKIILSETSINSLLKSYSKSLLHNVIKNFEYKGANAYLSQVISGYIDCDRLDYLHRDSYYVGVPYGLTGSDRIILSLEIDKKDKRLVVSESIGLDAVIHYLHARYSMYQQVYQHKKNLACDFLLRKLIERIRKIKPHELSKSVSDWLFLDDRTDVNTFLEVDDYSLVSDIKKLISSEDKILSDLSKRFISRNLFKSYEFRNKITKEKQNKVLELAKSFAISKKLDSNYYVGLEKSLLKPYEPYHARGYKTGNAIFIKQQSRKIKELSRVSPLVKALSRENIVKTCLVFAPELESEINNLKGFQELFK